MAVGIDAARAVAGAILIDKPAGPTSHDVVAFVRRTLKLDRAGHTGTLDPLATGLLIVLVGSATRLAQFLAADEKEYVADVRLGIATRTYDRASLDEALAASAARTSQAGASRPEAGTFDVRTTANEIEGALARFRGTFLQTPPPYSAKKIASVPAYEKARKNQSVDLKPVEVTVRELEILELPTSNATAAASGLQGPASAGPLRLRAAASAGFYVRSLAHEIGEALGCGAHLEALRRTRVGRFRVDEALTLDRVGPEAVTQLTSPSELLGHMPSVTVSDEAAQRVTHGNPVRGLTPGPAGPVRHVRILDGAGHVLAVAEARPGGLLQPVVVLR